MDNKKILLIFVVIIAVAVVAAAAVVMSNANTVNVGGVDFKLPEGFVQNQTESSYTESSVYDGNFPVNVTQSYFSKGDDAVVIGVMDCGSPDNAKKAHDQDIKGTSLTEKTINGHDGVYADKGVSYEFHYCKDKYNIRIMATNETLLEGAVS